MDRDGSWPGSGGLGQRHLCPHDSERGEPTSSLRAGHVDTCGTDRPALTREAKLFDHPVTAMISMSFTLASLPTLHIHDLRHSGNTWAASAGASTAALMARLGHSSTRAAMIYQHATPEQDVAIAEALGRRMRRQPNRSWHALGTKSDSPRKK